MSQTAPRWLSFQAAAQASYGVIDSDDEGYCRNLGALAGAPADLLTAIASDATERLLAEVDRAPRVPLSELRFLPPIPNPSKILCVGLNYRAHQEETGRGGEGVPTIFTRFPSSQVGHEGIMLRPQESATLDYEGEIAIIVGRRARRIKASAALDHLFGVSIYNDGSVREYQRHTSQFTPGKNFPSTGAFGPWIVPFCALEDPDALQLTTRLNGTVMQQATAAQMVHGFAEILEYCARFTELEPGDVIVTGTPGGVGAARTPPVFLDQGDRIEVELSGVGVLRNRVEVG
ncbi:MAG: fumarylacetoacetate hydrolase family protein [Pseudomonadota bacterium]